MLSLLMLIISTYNLSSTYMVIEPTTPVADELQNCS